MKVETLNNAYKVSGIDLHDDEECKELGRLIANECVVFVDQEISEQRLYDIQMLWGDVSTAVINQYVYDRRLKGPHWHSLMKNMMYITQDVKEQNLHRGMARVSYKKNKRGKPVGIFTNGELDWHSDQQATYEAQRVIGLMSLEGTENSQTSFLCTAKAYASLNHDDKSMVDELISVWAWDGGSMSKDLIDDQKQIVRAHMVPVDGMECPLVDQTASGVKGMKFPSHAFSHFRGMTVEESLKVKEHLWSILNKDEYIYVHDWKDKQIMFMDQNITLHARPTNVLDGDKRTLSRMVSYMNKLYPDNQPMDYVMFKGEKLSHDDFVKIVDDQRKQEYYGNAA
jgi:alpha-ketoglutarate-dependent taurine dioxygenase